MEQMQEAQRVVVEQRHEARQHHAVPQELPPTEHLVRRVLGMALEEQADGVVGVCPGLVLEGGERDAHGGRAALGRGLDDGRARALLLGLLLGDHLLLGVEVAGREAKAGLSCLDGVAVVEADDLVDAIVVDQGAIDAAEVFEEIVVAIVGDAEVLARRLAVEQHQIRAAPAAGHHGLLGRDHERRLRLHVAAGHEEQLGRHSRPH